MKVDYILRPIKKDTRERLFIVGNRCHVFKKVGPAGLHFLQFAMRDFQLLNYLSWRAGRLVDFYEIAKVFNPMDTSNPRKFSESLVYANISRLRKKIGIGFIEKTRPLGYFIKRDYELESLNPTIEIEQLPNGIGYDSVYLPKYQKPQKTGRQSILQIRHITRPPCRVKAKITPKTPLRGANKWINQSQI